jgi:cytochrome c biogenesis factor
MTVNTAMDDRRRQQRLKNLALSGALFAFAAVMFAVTLVKLGVWQ